MIRSLISIACVLLLAVLAGAFPDEERTQLDLGLQAATDIKLDGDNHRIYLINNGDLKVIDLATFTIATASDLVPFDLSTDEDLDATLQGVDFNAARDELYVTQDGGFLLTYELNNLDAEPTQTEIIADKELTLLATDNTNNLVYIYNETDKSVIRFTPSSGVATAIALTIAGESNFNVADMRYVAGVSGNSGVLYLSTDVGQLFALADGATAASVVVLDDDLSDDLQGIAATPDSDHIYVVNESAGSVYKVQTSNNTLVSEIEITENNNLSHIVVASVTNPTATYAFIVGNDGLTIIDTSDDDVLDMNSTSTDDEEPLAISGVGRMVASEDEYVFISYGDIAMITGNPLVTVSSTTISSGGASLGLTDSVSIAFQSDVTGTYTLRLNGTVDQDGSLLTDSSGSSSGSVTTAATDQSVTINYADHSSAWVEGTNNIFIFVSDDDGNVGRAVAQITVDTPPSDLSIASTGFGDERAYVNVTRLTAADISSYRLYVDTDAAAVLTKTEVAASKSQPDSGATIELSATGLDNGTSYFVAVEAVDSAGNVSANRITVLSSGATASVTPEATFGPAGFAGESGGCTLRIQGARS